MEQMILRAKRIRAAAAEAIAEALRGSLLPTAVISGFISALLAVYSPAEESAPFGTGCAIGVWYAGVSPYFALAGAFAVYLLRGGYAHAAACAVLAGAILFAERIRSVRRIYRLLIGFGAEAAMLCLSAAVRGGSGLMALGASSVSILIAVITGHAVNALGILSSREDIADTEL